jgi:hypothetical protein
MKLFLKLFLLFWISILLQKCVSEKQNQGQVVFQRRFYDGERKTLQKDSTYSDRVLLFHNGYVIQPARISNVVVDPMKKVTIDTSIDRYIFYDFQKKLVSEFDSFTVTARLLKKYPLVDSVFIPNTWNFYRTKELIFRDSLYTLDDTVMNNISYSRVVGTKKGGHQIIGYSRNDIKNSLFHLDKPLDDKMNGTIVRIDYWYLPANKAMISSFNFIRNYLTSEEKAVFNAWKKK